MRRLLVALALLTACSPAQEQAWLRWFHRDPQAATHWAIHECNNLCSDDWDRDGMVEPEPARDADPVDHPGEPDQWAPSGACSQWYGTAIGAGWTDADWPTLDRIMYAESRCSSSAYNPEPHFGGNASGLMQIIWPTWAQECGSGDIFDPWFNLSCAHYLKSTYGWGQWSTY